MILILFFAGIDHMTSIDVIVLPYVIWHDVFSVMQEVGSSDIGIVPYQTPSVQLAHSVYQLSQSTVALLYVL